MPWIWGTLTLADDHETSDPYHLVWPRDFYHAATAQKAAGDDAAADRLVDYLWRVQKTTDGSFWQNTRVDGTPVWTSQQLDETSLPVVLAWWLGRTGADDWDNIRAAADYVVANGPRSGQERWENQDGYSPNTIATEIAALVCAADVARTQRRSRPRGVVRGHGRRLAGEGGELDRDDQRPLLPQALLPAGDQGRQARTTARSTRSATTSRARSTSARSSTTRSWASCCSASSATTTRRSSTR